MRTILWNFAANSAEDLTHWCRKVSGSLKWVLHAGGIRLHN